MLLLSAFITGLSLYFTQMLLSNCLNMGEKYAVVGVQKKVIDSGSVFFWEYPVIVTLFIKSHISEYSITFSLGSFVFLH